MPAERPCTYCGSALPDRFAECSACGWRLGSVPVARHHLPDGSMATTFAAERRSKLRATAALMATLFGLVMIIAGLVGLADPQVSPETAPGWFVLQAAVGGIFAMNGIAAITYTRFGRYWWGLTAGERAAVVPGLILGAFASVFLILVFLATWAVLNLRPKAEDF